jgi:hypothetical protein
MRASPPTAAPRRKPATPVRGAARGPLRTVASSLCVALAWGPKAAPCRGLGVAALAFSEGALRCSLREAGCDESAAPLNAALHRAFSPVRRLRAGLPLSALRCSPAPMRPVRALPSGPGSRGASRALEDTPPVPARLWAGRSGRELSAPSSAVERGAADRLRAAGEKALCAGASSASAESSQPPSRSEQRRGPGLQGRAPMPERPGLPARSLARADLNADVRNGPQAAPGSH